MLRTVTRVTSAFLAFAIAFPAAAADPPFPDMAKSWYRYVESVKFLTDKKVIGGYPDGTFKPNAVINRAEFLKLVFAARSGTEPGGSECFRDIPVDSWYGPYVCAAKRRGIVSGYKDGTFKAEQPVNNAEAIKMLLLAYYGHDVEDRAGEKWYEPYVSLLDRGDILPRSSYVPWAPLSRERAADLIVRVLRHDEERIVPMMSPGCGKAEVENVPTIVTVNGVERNYLLTMPRRYTSREPSPLIIAFHGRTNSNERVRSYMGLDRAGENYFIAYPAGIDTGKGSFNWSDPGDKGANVRDVAFFDAMVKQIGERYCVDLDRIFVAGHSLGAWMANTVACARGGVVRGSATVGGNSVLTDCPGPSAAMILNNPKDTLSPHKSAELVRDQRMKENACSDRNAPVEPSAFKCVAYEGCNMGSPVLWCPHEIDHERNGTYYPHTWPEGTGEAMIKFFDDL